VARFRSQGRPSGDQKLPRLKPPAAPAATHSRQTEHLHNNLYAAMQLFIVATCQIISIALLNTSHTIHAALQLDINVALQ
jgi:hypothetical protein